MPHLLDNCIGMLLSFLPVVAALQAGEEAVSGGRSRRSGVTPGTIVSASFRRVRESALVAHDSSRRTRRVGAPTTVFDQSRRHSVLIRGLAEAFMAGPWDLDGLVDRGGRVLGRQYRWLRPLARRVLAAFPIARGPSCPAGRVPVRRRGVPEGMPESRR